MNDRDLVIVATLGRTDVQVAHRVDDRWQGYKIEDSSQRAFHEACESDEVKWEMLPLQQAAEMGDDRDVAHLRYDRQSRQFSVISAGTGGVWMLGAPLLGRLLPLVADLRWPSSPTSSSTGELGRPARQVADLGGTNRVVEVLLLTTRRPGDAREPVASASLVRDKVAEAWGLKPEQVHPMCCVTEPDLYEQDDDGDRLLRASVASRIDEAIRNAAERQPGATLVISDTGGIPEIKPVLATSAMYRFGDRVRWLPSTERRGGRSPAPAGKPRIPPLISLQTRHLVRLLLDRGDIASAAQLAMVLPRGLTEVEPWRRWLKVVADRLAGARFPIPNVPSEARTPLWIARAPLDLPTFRAAMRIESAVRRGDWVIAMRETFTFRDLARETLLNQCLSLDSNKPWINFKKLAIDYKLARLRADQRLLPEERERFATAWKPLKKLDSWLPPEEGAALRDLNVALEPLRDLRNQATHNGLDHAEVGQVRDKCLAKGLWLADPERFLESDRVAPLFKVLGFPEPAKAWEDLMSALAADMDAYSLQD